MIKTGPQPIFSYSFHVAPTGKAFIHEVVCCCSWKLKRLSHQCCGCWKLSRISVLRCCFAENFQGCQYFNVALLRTYKAIRTYKAMLFLLITCKDICASCCGYGKLRSYHFNVVLVENLQGYEYFNVVFVDNLQGYDFKCDIVASHTLPTTWRLAPRIPVLELMLPIQERIFQVHQSMHCNKNTCMCPVGQEVKKQAYTSTT